MHIVLDFIPNHTSDKHPWFVKSRSSADSNNMYRNYYVWSGETTNWVILLSLSLLNFKSLVFKIKGKNVYEHDAC